MTRESGPKAAPQVTPTDSQVTTDQARAILDRGPSAVERLWQEVVGIWQTRNVDPKLRAAVIHLAQEVDPALAEQIKHELDEAVPAAVLEAHWRELIPDKPALGAFPRQVTTEAPTLDEWLRVDPRRLRGIVLEACRFSRDERRVVEGVLELAHRLGIDLALASDIVTHALIDARARDNQAVAR